MKNQWKSFFYFTKTERNGLFVLLLCCLFFFFSPYWIPLIFPVETELDFSEFEKEVAEFQNANTAAKTDASIPKASPPAFAFDPNTISELQLQQLGIPPKVISNLLNYRSKGGRFYKREDFKKIYGLSPEDYQRLENFINIKGQAKKGVAKQQSSNKIPNPPRQWNLQPFNPNTASQEELIEIGISAKAAGTIVKYRSKGGSFRKKEDLKKIFGISAEDYTQLAPFIHISNTQNIIQNQEQANPEVPEAKSAPIVLDINQSTAGDWQQIKGIGPFYSKKIINWREKLGGFYTIDQVGETFGLPDSVFQKVQGHLKISPVLNQLRINHIQTKELQKHPYLNFKQANAIVNFRKNHGPFQQADDLKKVRAISSETLEKILPYLSFE